MWTGLFEGVGIAALTTAGVGAFLGPGIVFGIWQLHRGDQLDCMQVRALPATPEVRHDEIILRPVASPGLEAAPAQKTAVA